ncbi:ComEA family DNA-binding protein [Pseudazoarcus pumilus]|uniref:Competence protein ComE n=1 Tax=Pseudazoarcus pumilus TaxID=2067960 RepID=A0A2I6S8W6_9RHOO|nr:helix-hairpin-helix domain-containing protein [Pseudazoarcus pumilus]AUN95671.1 competence protein ComE [Pseudazoarcus pumilus]
MYKSLRCLVLACLFAPLVVFAAGVDINTADAAALEQVRGIGPARAAAIIDYRDKNGPFKSVDELTKVPGIGEKSLDSMRDQVRVGAAKSAKGVK